MLRTTLGGAVLATALTIAIPAYAAPGTAFTYQGQLNQAGTPVDDLCDMTFTLWDAETAGAPVAGPLTLAGVNVVDGTFAADIDFGVEAHNGDTRWLEITVQCASDEAPVTLSPRQPLRPTPKAIFAQAATQSFTLYDGSDTPLLEMFAEYDEEEDIADGGVDMYSTDGLYTELAAGDLVMYANFDDDTALVDIFADGSFGGLVGVNRADGTLGSRMGPGYVVASDANGVDRAGITDAGIFMNHPNGNQDIFIGNGALYASDSAGVTRVSLDANSQGQGGINVSKADGSAGVIILGGTIYADEIWAQIKNFCIPNPDDARTELWYACPEGPEAAVYVRGTAKLVDGRAVVTFPKHFKSIVNSESVTVTVTPRSAESKGLAVVERSRGGFLARELNRGQGSYEFDWHAMAVRTGYEDYEVVRPARERTDASMPATR